MKSNNRLCRLKKFGQSVWLDFITRDLFRPGQLARLVIDDCISGMTVNPTIFEQSVMGTDAYDEDIKRLAKQYTSTREIYYELMVTDVVAASGILYAVYLATKGIDGYVSMEVAPEYAYDIQGTIKKAKELRLEAGRCPNIMIKVPGTAKGITAIRQLTAEGININVTLLFSAKQYLSVADAYMSGLEDRLAKGLPVDNIASVASLFVSRIDTLVDKKIDAKIQKGSNRAEQLKKLRGKLGVGTAKLAYRAYEELQRTERWQKLAAAGARLQRLLWGSTSTKDPAYSDVKYIEELIGPKTINTMPLKTLEAFRDHGRADNTLIQNIDEAGQLLSQFEEFGFNLDEIYSALQEEGVQKFADSYNHLFSVLEDKCSRMLAA